MDTSQLATRYSTVMLFSKSKYIFLGPSSPVNILFKGKINCRRGDLTNVLAKTKSLVLKCGQTEWNCCRSLVVRRERRQLCASNLDRWDALVKRGYKFASWLLFET